MWLETHQSLQRHPKTLIAAKRLGIPRPQLIGHLLCLWWWTMEYAPTGNLAPYGADGIAVAAEWDGDADAWTATLVAAGFLDDDLCVHDWMDYAGRVVQKRLANAARMKAARASHVQDTCTARAPHVQGLPNLTIPNQTKKTSAPDGAAPERVVAKRTAPAYSQPFCAFWDAYHPSGKTSKAAAWKIWKRDGLDEHLDAILVGVQRWHRSQRWADGFVADATTFLNQQRWEGEPPQARRSSSTPDDPRFAALLAANPELSQ